LRIGRGGDGYFITYLGDLGLLSTGNLVLSGQGARRCQVLGWVVAVRPYHERPIPAIWSLIPVDIQIGCVEFSRWSKEAFELAFQLFTSGALSVQLNFMGLAKLGDRIYVQPVLDLLLEELLRLAVPAGDLRRSTELWRGFERKQSG
jgi:hypothetical protein